MSEDKKPLPWLAMMKKTGNIIPFLEVGIGNPFFAHNKIWIRVSYQAAKELAPGSIGHTSVCNFTIDKADKLVGEIETIIAKTEGK